MRKAATRTSIAVLNAAPIWPPANTTPCRASTWSSPTIWMTCCERPRPAEPTRWRSPMTSEDRIEALLRRVEELEQRVQRQDDIQAVRTLQFKYGYFMDKCLFAEIVELFSEDAELRFMGGIFRGKAGARRLYGGSSGLNGPADGMLFEHIIAQDVVDIAPDGRTAYGRFRTFLQGGVHETKKDAPPQIPSQFWEAGIYENEYIKEGGLWKFKVFNYR